MTQAGTITLSRRGHRALRLLLVGWFTGVAAGLLPWPQGDLLAQELLPGALGGFALHAVVFALAWALTLGPDLRRPALFLSLLIALAAVHAKLSGLPEATAPAAFWRDVALLLGLALCGLPERRGQDTGHTSGTRATGRQLVRRAGPSPHHHPSGARGPLGRAAFAESPDEMASGLLSCLQPNATPSSERPR